jgi:hypothetical protein
LKNLYCIPLCAIHFHCAFVIFPIRSEVRPPSRSRADFFSVHLVAAGPRSLFSAAIFVFTVFPPPVWHWSQHALRSGFPFLLRGRRLGSFDLRLWLAGFFFSLAWIRFDSSAQCSHLEIYSFCALRRHLLELRVCRQEIQAHGLLSKRRIGTPSRAAGQEHACSRPLRFLLTHNGLGICLSAGCHLCALVGSSCRFPVACVLECSA